MPSTTSKINDHTVGSTGYGLMTFTFGGSQGPDEETFPVMKAAINNGATFWNTADFYGNPNPLANLELINRYFKKYPEDAKKVYIACKGGISVEKHGPDHSPESLQKSVDDVSRLLGEVGVDYMFVIARIDANIPIEETAKTMKRYMNEGKIKRWGLSECSAETLEKAHKVTPVSAVEIEFSVWSQEAVHNGVMAKCVEYGIPVIAYSPLGRGYLTGTLKSADDVAPFFKIMKPERLQQENMDKNQAILDKLSSVAEKYNGTLSQVALDWVRNKSNAPGFPTIVPIPGTTKAERVEQNCKELGLSKEDVADIDKFMTEFQVSGLRTNKHHEETLSYR